MWFERKLEINWSESEAKSVMELMNKHEDETGEYSSLTIKYRSNEKKAKYNLLTRAGLDFDSNSLLTLKELFLNYHLFKIKQNELNSQ